MALPAQIAGWFLLFTFPICVYAAYSDLSRMKIPNRATDALFIVYVVLGLILLPFTTYLWGFAYFAIALVLGFVLNGAGAMGAGDAKFIASAAPFIALPDLPVILAILAAALLAGFATHRLAKFTGLKRLAPGWESWGTGKRFPMGFPLAMALTAYFVLAWRLG